MKMLYEKVGRQLDRLDFEALWPGFHRCPFALYDGVHAILDGQAMDCPQEFRGCTTVNFKERQIAIWNVGLGLPGDDVRLASGLAHEMFHAFQMERGEGRFPNDFVLAGAKPSPEYLALKAEECRQLAQPGGLARFRALREERRALSAGLVREEELAETVEGMAQYVEMCALGQLSADGRQAKDAGQGVGSESSVGENSVGNRQQAALAECKKRLADPKWLLDSRRCAYDSGALLLFAAARQGISLFHEIGEESRPVYDVIQKRMPPVRMDAPEGSPMPFRPEVLAFWAGILSERTAQREALIRAFLQEEHTTVKGDFRICGYDPMNLWREGDVLYSTSFLCLVDQDGGMVTLPGKVLLQMRAGAVDVADAYCVLV